MKIVFFGTPQFSVNTLQALINSFHTVLAVVSQPDKPNGRNKKLLPPPVKLLAEKYGIPVYQFQKIRIEGVEKLKELNADCFVTCAYGQILSKEILDIPKYGVINVHGSLLPKYRGAAPVQWSIINGEKTSGITILKSDVGVDDGPIILKRELEIENGETANSLFHKLSVLGAEVLIEALSKIEDGTATYTKQNEEESSVCKMLKKEMSQIDFSMDAIQIVRLINGINSWPVAKLTVGNVLLKIYQAQFLEEDEVIAINKLCKTFKVGQVVVASTKTGLIIKAKNGYIKCLQVQPENGKIMGSTSFLNGKKIEVGTECK